MFSKETLNTVKRLQKARLALMRKQPFYAVLLLHMTFSLDYMCETAYTDGKRIAFCPDFIDSISDSELEFVLMHEVLHAALDHCGRTAASYDFDMFNTACDIVVNSNILYSCNMDLSAITLKEYGESMHVAPDEEEGYLYTAEEVYAMLESGMPPASGADTSGNGGEETPRKDGGFDDHTYWDSGDESDRQDRDEMREQWLQRMIEATTIANRIISNGKSGKNCGRIPLMAERLLKELTEAQTDWREILQDFVQDEINDYSFDPPDRRFQESVFLLPDFNAKESRVKNIWFVVDTSGSVCDNAIRVAYSEICAAIEQFDGKLEGKLSFMESAVTDPVPFDSVEAVLEIKPVGGGGTDFCAIFDYMNKKMADEPPSYIVIITDGYGDFPHESEAGGIPVLWLINNEEVDPPWGKTARIKVEE